MGDLAFRIFSSWKKPSPCAASRASRFKALALQTIRGPWPAALSRSGGDLAEVEAPGGREKTAKCRAEGLVLFSSWAVRPKSVKLRSSSSRQGPGGLPLIFAFASFIILYSF